MRRKDAHFGLMIKESGLCINTKWPHIGGIVECECCGVGVLEIKCPFSHKGYSILNATRDDKQFCLKKSCNGTINLDKEHTYYYQIQTQLHVLDVQYCDSCVCTLAADEYSSVYIEQLVRNDE